MIRHFPAVSRGGRRAPVLLFALLPPRRPVRQHRGARGLIHVASLQPARGLPPYIDDEERWAASGRAVGLHVFEQKTRDRRVVELAQRELSHPGAPGVCELAVKPLLPGEWIRSQGRAHFEVISQQRLHRFRIPGGKRRLQAVFEIEVTGNRAGCRTSSGAAAHTGRQPGLCCRTRHVQEARQQADERKEPPAIRKKEARTRLGPPVQWPSRQPRWPPEFGYPVPAV
jgi:hypothetical protein